MSSSSTSTTRWTSCGRTRCSSTTRQPCAPYSRHCSVVAGLRRSSSRPRPSRLAWRRRWASRSRARASSRTRGASPWPTRACASSCAGWRGARGGLGWLLDASLWLPSCTSSCQHSARRGARRGETALRPQTQPMTRLRRPWTAAARPRRRRRPRSSSRRSTATTHLRSSAAPRWWPCQGRARPRTRLNGRRCARCTRAGCRTCLKICWTASPRRQCARLRARRSPRPWRRWAAARRASARAPSGFGGASVTAFGLAWRRSRPTATTRRLACSRRRASSTT
mmetsp:Transcript_13406/g.40417  ORF Transcript_13406/g.40417 Transcript_13406/m.40417 type:complete len:281 (-) Transcript_13406:373-1215(-)